ncbi:hypothetical protein KTI63_03310 [Acinetobacter guillouiae]|uniref:hypothetical protein n=1 Tax=Acinetobacter guillouiae TaxID=106649 RepID=UPI0021D03EE4|nr:hypothetical protein [Acinetobacter guillouiae]MCU4491494.1 hypothetical protein [Acinetobacter guillouiae]
MDKYREAFEQIPEIKDSLSENIVFVGNKYTTANDGFYDLVNWLNGGWYTWQSRQAEVDQLQSQINEMAEVGLSLESELNKKDEHARDLYYENANLQLLVDEKDKRINELERSCNSCKNQSDDNAQKLMVKSVHYSSIQEELAKLKDRLELAHHLATQSTWSSLKQLKKVVKALRGEHE